MKYNKKLLGVMITITFFICIVVGGILVNASKKSDANKAIVAKNKVESAAKVKAAQMEEEKASLAKLEEEKAKLAKVEEEKLRLAQMEEEQLRLAQIEEEEEKVVKIVATKVNVSQTAAEKAAAEKAATEKAATEKAATEKAATEKAAAEKAAAEKIAAEKAAAEKALAEKIAAELEQINIINQAAADAVNIAIAALPAEENVVLDYEAIINAASTKYNNLTDTQKQMVSTENKTKLSKVLAKLAKLKDWTLQWSDEFNGSTLETSKWSYDLGNAIVNSDGSKEADGWGNNELQYYTNSSKNIALENGNLQINAIKEKSPEQFGKTFDYTSGKIKTLGKFSMKYGKIDIKAKLPLGKGFWPAIWMLPANDVYGGWASSGEIDIVEGWGSKPQTVAGTLHYASTWPNNKYTGKEYNFPETTSVNEFHNYSLEWEPGEIRWYVDGVLYQTQNNWYTKGVNNEEKYSFPAPFDQDFYLILNLAVGGNFDGDPTVDTKFPSAMEIDYVRAYKLTGREYKTPVEPNVEVEPLPTGAKIATADGNLLSNGDFSQPIQDNPEGTIDFLDKWNFVHGSQFGGNGTQSIDTIDGNKYAKINVTSGGAQNYSVQLIQLTTLGKGRYYKVSFDAKAAANRALNMKMGGGEEVGWSVYSDSYNFDLTDKFQHFEKVFQMASDSNIKSRLEFNLGLDTNTVWIGNARIEEVDAPIQNANASKTPLSDGNRIYNGTFDKESIDRMAYWNFSVAGAQATASVAEDTRELFVKVNNGGANPSTITLNQKGIQLAQKDVYELTFKARANAPKTIKVDLLSKDGTVSYLDEQTISLTTEMKEQKISFTMDKATDLEAQILFKLGGDKNDVYMDDVSLIPTTEFIDYSLVDLYPLKNGDFSNGLESWSPYPNIGDGGNSTITEINGEAKISVVAPGPNPYSVMLNQEKFKVTKGIEYLLAFDVRSTAVRNITAVIDNAAYDQYLSKTVEAKNGMTHYEYIVKMAKTDTVNLKFLLGNVDANVPTSAHDIFIDNVVFEVKNAPFKKSPTLVQNVTNNKLTQPIDVTFTDDATWRNAITFVKINDTVISSDKYTVSAGKITLASENFEAIGNYNIVVIAYGYADATCVQNIRANDNLIISNGTFDTNTTGWEVYAADGSDATVNSVGGEMVVTFPNYAGWQKWSTQIYQNTIRLEAGKTYELKFNASSTVARDAWMEMSNMDSQTLALTPTNKTFTYEFTAANTILNGKLNFLLGTSNLDGALFTKNQSVILDNVSITEKTGGVVIPKSPTLVANSTNNKVGEIIDVTFTDDIVWRTAISDVKINGTSISTSKYTISAGKITFTADNFATAGSYTVVITAAGYTDATIVQTIKSISGDIINNGTFDTNVTGWNNYTADGSDAAVTSVGGEMIVNFPNYAGWEKWSTQVYQDTIQLEEGKTYVLKFDARSTVARDAWMEMNNMDSQVLALTPTNKTFTYEFTAANTILNGKLNFLLGTSNLDGALFTKNQSVILDNVSISEKTGEIVTPEVPTSENEVVNGDFSGETIAPWTNWSDGAVTVDQVNGEAKIDLNGFGGDPWSVQFSQDGFKFEPNAKYTMSFKAKSSIARSFGMSVEGAGYFRYLDKLDNLTTDMNTYTYDFVVAKDETTKMVFLLGKTGNDVDGSVPCTINIDDVVITKAGSTTPDTPPTNDAVIVSQTDATVLGAENAINVVNGNLVDNDAIETGKSIQSKTASMMSFDFNINVAAAGKYSIIFRSNCTPSGSDLSFSAGANKVTAAGGADAAFNDITREMDLKAGAQIVSITGTPGMASTLTIKSITLNPIEIYDSPIIIGELTAIPSGVLTTLEAENAINIKNAIVALNDTVEGGSSLKATANMSFDFNVDVEKAGEYQITYRTNCGPDGLDLFLRSNGILLKHAPAPSGGTWGDTVITVTLDAGPQVLNVSGISSEKSTILINSIKLMPTGGGGSTGGGTSITNTEPTVLEAENATNVTGASVVNNDSTEGGSSLQSIAAGNPMTFNFNVSVETAGKYTITYRRKNSGIAGVYFELKNGDTMIDSIGVGPSDTWTDTTRTVTLKAGAQVLNVFAAPGESSILNINNITITPIK